MHKCWHYDVDVFNEWDHEPGPVFSGVRVGIVQLNEKIM